MSEPYVGEIRMFAGNFPPSGWAFCEGQLLSISENEVLFLLIGTTFGGDGVTNFALPDFRGRVPIHVGQGHALGEASGTESVALTVENLPTHSHPLMGTNTKASRRNPSNSVLAQGEGATYGGTVDGFGPTHLNVLADGLAGNSAPHDNMQPFLCLNFIISLFGIFPSRN
ncbi:MAG TPA: tail fiber protein [Candidatus Limnocylindria bacterium]|jgi:microcystin-dependent protein|nr:tail fiber protein [Candidatus Limnocylindria bacterium]